MAVSGEAVEKAVKALLKWRDLGESKSHKSQLLSSDDFVYLVVTLRKIPLQSRTNPYKLPLTHPLYSPDADGSEFCLFLDDRPDRRPTSKDAKAKIAAESIPLPKVIKFSKLKTDYKPFEAKRKLCDSYDMFLADRRIIPLLPKHLGKHFYKKRKIPVAVDLEHQNWKEQVERVCSSAMLHLKTGTCSTVRVARSSMGSGFIVDNVVAAIYGVVETVPNKWNNIRSLHLKLSDSLALPIYQSLPEAKLSVAETLPPMNEEESVAVVAEGKKKTRRGEVEVVLSSKKVASSKKGRIHQVRYMDDATAKDQNDVLDALDVDRGEEQVQAPKKSSKMKKGVNLKAKAKSDGIDELDVGDAVDGAEEEVKAPKMSVKMKKGLNLKKVKGKSDAVDGAEAPKKSAKIEKGMNSKAKGENDVVDESVIDDTTDGAEEELPAPKKNSAKMNKDVNLKAKVKKEASKEVELGEADGAKIKKARKVEVGETDGAKRKKAKKVQVVETDGAKIKKADKVRKIFGDAKSGSAKKSKRS